MDKNTKDKSLKVDLVAYGDLMMMVDNKKRWMYSGSVTTPPCATKVMWNVLSNVYPIKDKHLKQYKDNLDANDAGLSAKGNYRLIQKLNEHNLIYITDKADSVTIKIDKYTDEDTVIATITFFALMLFTSTVAMFYFLLQLLRVKTNNT